MKNGVCAGLGHGQAHVVADVIGEVEMRIAERKHLGTKVGHLVGSCRDSLLNPRRGQDGVPFLDAGAFTTGPSHHTPTMAR